MTGPGEAWGLAAQKWTELSGAIGDDDWDKSTTCDDWTVRELVDHTMHWQGVGASVVGADCAKGDDWATVSAAMAAALADPASLEGVVESYNNMPKHQMLGLVITDLLIHSWDLARSIDADASLPPLAVEATMLGLQRMPAEMLRSPNMFAAAVEVADDASAQDKLIAFVGRQP